MLASAPCWWVLRWVWERINLLAEAASIVVSFLLAPLLLLIVADDWLRLLSMAAAPTFAVVAAALFGPPTPRECLAECYRRVRPPGWWAESATAAGAASEAPGAELRRRLVLVAACAVSTYAWLLGAAEALLGSGPVRRAVLLRALGFLALRVWWPALRAAPTN